MEHRSDYGSSQAAGPRAKTSQKSRERPSKMGSKGATERPGAREQGFVQVVLSMIKVVFSLF